MLNRSSLLLSVLSTTGIGLCRRPTRFLFRVTDARPYIYIYFVDSTYGTLCTIDAQLQCVSSSYRSHAVAFKRLRHVVISTDMLQNNCYFVYPGPGGNINKIIELSYSSYSRDRNFVQDLMVCVQIWIRVLNSIKNNVRYRCLKALGLKKNSFFNR